MAIPKGKTMTALTKLVFSRTMTEHNINERTSPSTTVDSLLSNQQYRKEELPTACSPGVLTTCALHVPDLCKRHTLSSYDWLSLPPSLMAVPSLKTVEDPASTEWNETPVQDTMSFFFRNVTYKLIVSLISTILVSVAACEELQKSNKWVNKIHIAKTAGRQTHKQKKSEQSKNKS